MKSVELLEQFGSVRRALGRAISPHLQKMDVGPKQLVVLRVIGKRGECSMSAIAEATASDMASVTRMVSSLEASGWVQKRRDDSDRRQWVVKLSPKGLKKWDTIDSMVREIAAIFVTDLTNAEQEEFFRLLNKVQQGLDASLASHSASDTSSKTKTKE